jgi:N utilization substance protein B
MGARTKARKRALDILFESELRGLGSGATLTERREVNEPPVGDYTSPWSRVSPSTPQTSTS